MPNIDEDDDNIETETDETKKKAEAIGKQVAGEDDKIPDYEVIEEEDERLANDSHRRTEGDTKKNERRELSNKEKRELRKKRLKQRFGEKDAIIAKQQADIEELQQFAASASGVFTNIDQKQIEKDWREHKEKFEKAEREHSDAFKEGDGERATKTMREMYVAQKSLDKIEDAVAASKEAAKRRAAAPAQPKFDPKVTRYATDWAQRNSSWYKSDREDDEDTQMARGISVALVKQGYDPKTEEYWEELDKKIKKRMPHVTDLVSDDDLDDDDDNADDDQKQQRQKHQPEERKSTGPKVGGGAGRGDLKGKVTATIPKALMEEMKKNGIWEDKEKRNRVIHNYQKGRKDGIYQ